MDAKQAIKLSAELQAVRLKAEHDHAFEPLPDEQSIPIKSKDAKFTRHWFRSRNQKTWSTFLLPKFKGQPVRMLQIGVFEGADLLWCCENLMSDPASFAVGVDPWAATRKLDDEYMEGVYQRALDNLQDYGDRVALMRAYSSDFLFKNTLKPQSLDLAVIDGDHTAEAVIRDAEAVLPLMKRGGWMLFDDVRNRRPKRDHVQDGLDAFRERRLGIVRTVWQHRFCDCLEVL